MSTETGLLVALVRDGIVQGIAQQTKAEQFLSSYRDFVAAQEIPAFALGVTLPELATMLVKGRLIGRSFAEERLIESLCGPEGLIPLLEDGGWLATDASPDRIALARQILLLWKRRRNTFTKEQQNEAIRDFLATDACLDDGWDINDESLIIDLSRHFDLPGDRGFE